MIRFLLGSGQVLAIEKPGVMRAAKRRRRKLPITDEGAVGGLRVRQERIAILLGFCGLVGVRGGWFQVLHVYVAMPSPPGIS